ncbi:MAG: hypothetical protein M3300_05140, partial [Actinomycetota bacterium]|nr:hypothetical protein [Actinomycetota bacterium]
MPRRGLLTGFLVGGLIAGGSLAAMPASAEPALVPLSPSLASQLLPAVTGQLPVMVHGATLADAQRAVAATGMRQVATFRKIGVVAASGTKQQIEAARTQPGVTYLEGDEPLASYAMDTVPTQKAIRSTSLLATRGLEAQQTLT